MTDDDSPLFGPDVADTPAVELVATDHRALEARQWVYRWVRLEHHRAAAFAELRAWMARVRAEAGCPDDR